jgi:hypothetical protein
MSTEANEGAGPVRQRPTVVVESECDVSYKVPRSYDRRAIVLNPDTLEGTQVDNEGAFARPSETVGGVGVPAASRADGNRCGGGALDGLGDAGRGRRGDESGRKGLETSVEGGCIGEESAKASQVR